jgi:hypothetical protein
VYGKVVYENIRTDKKLNKGKIAPIPATQACVGLLLHISYATEASKQ